MTIIEGRPWPETGLTTERWMTEVPVTSVWIDNLFLCQSSLNIRGLLNAARGGLPMYGDAIPHVVSWQGLLFLEDGHHRVVAAAVRGEPIIDARVYAVQ